MRAECWIEGQDCGKHKKPLLQTGTLRTAPPYSKELDTDKDLLECPESGQLFHMPTENAAQAL
jgi:hypothetical protein